MKANVLADQTIPNYSYTPKGYVVSCPTRAPLGKKQRVTAHIYA
jgi:hypothetical protein